MPEGYEDMHYFGYGPMETYIDRHNAARIGKYSISVNENFEHYIAPQENSSHFGTRWGIVNDAHGNGLYFSGYNLHDFCFNASHYTSEILTSTKHDFELKPLKQTVINLDWKMNSISQNTQIAAIEKDRILNDKKFCFSFRILPVNITEIEPFQILNEKLYSI